MATKTAKDIENEISSLKNAQDSLMTWVDIDDEYIKKDPSLRDWWDKAFGNSNPDLKDKNKLYREYANSIADLQSRLTNLKSAEQFMTDVVSENKDRINKIYDLQNKAAALSAWIQWTNRVAWWLWAASNVLNNSQWLTDATLRQSVAQNEAARQTALLNNAQQALNIPSTLASIWQANSQIAYNAALTNQLNNQRSSWSWGWSSWWYKSSWWGWGSEYTKLNEITVWWKKIKWTFYKDKNWNYYSSDWRLVYDKASWWRDNDFIPLNSKDTKNNTDNVKKWNSFEWLDFYIPSLKEKPDWNNVVFKKITL